MNLFIKKHTPEKVRVPLSFDLRDYAPSVSVDSPEGNTCKVLGT